MGFCRSICDGPGYYRVDLLLFRKGKQNVQQLLALNNAITVQKIQLEEALEALDISNKEKERIIYIVAHELRSPVSGIAAVAHSMLEQHNFPEKQEELLVVIENTAAASLRLINELLESQEKNSNTLQKTTCGYQCTGQTDQRFIAIQSRRKKTGHPYSIARCSGNGQC